RQRRNGGASLELEREPDRSSPVVEVRQREPGDAVGFRSAEAAEVPEVSAQSDVLREEAHHAAAEVEAEVVLGRDVERLTDVLHVAADEAAPADDVGANRGPVSTHRNADDRIAGERDDVAVVRECEI